MGAAEKGHALVVERLLTAGAQKEMESNVGSLPPVIRRIMDLARPCFMLPFPIPYRPTARNDSPALVRPQRPRHVLEPPHQGPSTAKRQSLRQNSPRVGTRKQPSQVRSSVGGTIAGCAWALHARLNSVHHALRRMRELRCSGFMCCAAHASTYQH